MGVPRVSVRSQRTKRASSRLRAARAKAAHYICHHGLADFASWLRLFRESERPVRIGEELDNLQLNGDRFRGCARSHASIGLGVATLRGIAVLGTLRTLTITS